MMAKDPQTRVDRIEELARRVLQGDIVLPKFQRNFVWEKEQVLTLLDSIAKGFPIGSVLLWESREELRSENRIADLEITLPRKPLPVSYVLDGQQRLSAICGVLFWKGRDPKSRWNVAYDLRSRTFLHLNTIDSPPAHQIRVNLLSDSSSYFRHIANLDLLITEDKQQLKRNADLLFNRFKDYKIPTITLGDMLMADVAPIFERINSSGTLLTIVDLMRAATWSIDFDLVDAIDEIVEKTKARGFGEIDRKVVLRNLAAAVGGNFTASSIEALREREAPELQSAAASCSVAYDRAIDFLINKASVPNARVIPYANQITALAELFRRLPSPSISQLAAIARWFWRSSLTGHFGGWNTGMMAADLRAIEKFVSGGTEIAIEFTVPDESIWINTPFRTNTARTKLLALLLGHQQPCDLLTGIDLDADVALKWEEPWQYGCLFPSSYLKFRGEDAVFSGSLANYLIISPSTARRIVTQSPAAYLAEVEDAAGSDLENRLISNLIPLEAFEAARANDYLRFLQLRAGFIQATVKALC